VGELGNLGFQGEEAFEQCPEKKNDVEGSTRKKVCFKEGRKILTECCKNRKVAMKGSRKAWKEECK